MNHRKKTVIKEKYINITTRKRKSDSDKENDKQHTKIKRTKQLKLANSTNAILNHYTDNDKTVKAKIVANVIDKEGEDFGKDVLKYSKSIQQNLSMTPDQSVSLIAGTGTSDYVWTQARTAMNKTLGFNTLASFKKVAAHRESILVIDKSKDCVWEFALA